MKHYACPERLLSDTDQQPSSDLSGDLYKLLDMRKIATSAHHPNGNGTERGNHGMTQMLSTFVDNRKNVWDRHLLTSCCLTTNRLTPPPASLRMTSTLNVSLGCPSQCFDDKRLITTIVLISISNLLMNSRTQDSAKCLPSCARNTPSTPRALRDSILLSTT